MIPIAFDDAQLRSGGIHWSWDSTKPTYFGVLRRGGDGKDLQWIEGPTRSATHVIGAFSDGEKVYVDVEMSMSNPFPFVPMRDGSQWNPIAGTSHIMRLSADLSRGRARALLHRGSHPARQIPYYTFDSCTSSAKNAGHHPMTGDDRRSIVTGSYRSACRTRTRH